MSRTSRWLSASRTIDLNAILGLLSNTIAQAVVGLQECTDSEADTAANRSYSCTR